MSGAPPSRPPEGATVGASGTVAIGLRTWAYLGGFDAAPVAAGESASPIGARNTMRRCDTARANPYRIRMRHQRRGEADSDVLRVPRKYGGGLEVARGTSNEEFDAAGVKRILGMSALVKALQSPLREAPLRPPHNYTDTLREPYHDGDLSARHGLLVFEFTTRRGSFVRPKPRQGLGSLAKGSGARKGRAASHASGATRTDCVFRTSRFALGASGGSVECREYGAVPASPKFDKPEFRPKIGA